MNWFVNMFKEAELSQVGIEILRHTLTQTLDEPKDSVLRWQEIEEIIKIMEVLCIPVAWELHNVATLLDTAGRGAYHPSKELSYEVKQQVWKSIKKGLEKFSNEKEITIYLKENVRSFKNDDSIKV